VDEAAARAVLGVDAVAAWPEIRASYLRLVRRHHPDGADDLADSGRRTLRTAQITEAFAVLVAVQERSPAAPAEEPPAPAHSAGASLRHPAVGLDETRTVLLDAAPMDAFLALLEVFSMLGAVSYVDRLSLVLETIVTPEPGRATSLLAWLDPERDALTRATLGVESLGGHPPADLDALVDRAAELLGSPRPPAGPT